MGNTKDTEDTIKHGVLLERQPANLELTLNKMRFALLIGGMIFLVIIIVISNYLALFISRPITKLSTIVTEVRSGSYVLIDEHQSLDEINALSIQLNFLTERLEKTQSESERVVGERAQLFAEISHELRTPLTAVQGFTEAIRDGIVEDENLRNKYLDMIHTQTLHLARLVDDILALSRLESGDVTIEKSPIDLVALTQGVVMSMEGLAKAKDASILFEKKMEKAVVIGDGDRMEQILRNLIKNAINASENGIIKVGVGNVLDEVMVTIEDNGMGISPDDLPHIWDRFYRAKNQRNKNNEEKGTGLGLVIVKKLVQLQNGKIEAESQLGNGTSFYISFPSFVGKK
jgi:signal transduction histidine kinase